MYFYKRHHYTYSPHINNLLKYDIYTNKSLDVRIDTRTGNLKDDYTPYEFEFFVNIRTSLFSGEVPQGYYSTSTGINFLTSDLFRFQTNAIKIWEF